MKRGTIDLSHIATIVLDEADEMLDMGFIDDINLIMAATPTRARLCSSRLPCRNRSNSCRNLPSRSAHDSHEDQRSHDGLIEQSYIEVPDRQKFDILCRLLDLQEPDLAIIFVRTKRRVDEVSEALKKRGYSSEGIHGDLTQAKRDTVIRQFREKTIDILVATDVAARGLDISGVTHVFNYDLPQDPESYVHRVGRTGRAGQSGEATTFVIPREMEHLRTIERLIKRSIARRKAPTFSEALEGAQQAAIRNLAAAAEEGNFGSYKENAEELLANYDSASLIAAAIKLLTKEPDTTPVKITEEAPLRVHRSRQAKITATATIAVTTAIGKIAATVKKMVKNEANAVVTSHRKTAIPTTTAPSATTNAPKKNNIKNRTVPYSSLTSRTNTTIEMPSLPM